MLLQRLWNTQQLGQKLVVVHLTVYVYESRADTFKPLPDMPKDLPQQILHANEALRHIAAGQAAYCMPNTVSCSTNCCSCGWHTTWWVF